MKLGQIGFVIEFMDIGCDDVIMLSFLIFSLIFLCKTGKVWKKFAKFVAFKSASKKKKKKIQTNKQTNQKTKQKLKQKSKLKTLWD